VWTVAKVLVGFVIPLLVFLPLLALLWFGIRRLRANRRAKKEAQRVAAMPPPPSAPLSEEE